jgi:pimeloyl-ACP methyl ester carboxylesterase
MKKNTALPSTICQAIFIFVIITNFFSSTYSQNFYNDEVGKIIFSENSSRLKNYQDATLIGNNARLKIFDVEQNTSDVKEILGFGRQSQTLLSFLAVPSVSSISPSTPQTSTSDQNIMVNGSNFTSGLTVTVTFPSGGTGTLSGSQLQSVTSSSFVMRITLNAAGTWRIRVNNSSGEQSSQFSFNVVSAQTPSISSVSPSSPTVSSSDQNVQVTGSNFQNGMTVTIFFPGGGNTTLSGTQLQNITLTSFRMIVTLNIVGTYGIRINNPSGLQSVTFNFSVQAATPSISSISPSGVCAQSGDRNFTVNGSNFVSGLTVTVFFPGGGNTTISGSQIQNVTSTSFTMTVTLNVIGTYSFRINNSSGTQSSQFSYATQNCNPNISSINPSSPVVSSSNQTVGVSGSNFQSGLTVTVFFPGGGSAALSGSQIQFNSSTSFNMIVTLNIVGQYQLRINNSNGTASPNFSFNTQAAAPTISSISPPSPCVRNVDQSVTVNGSNFANGLTVSVTFPNGGTATLSGSQIQNVTATSFTMIITLADPGSYTIRVVNPSGAQSGSFNFSPQSCLSISGINPSSPTQSNVNQDITVNGSGFAANLTVIVTLPDSSTVTLSGTQILNVTSTSFTMRATLNAAGQWKIKVLNPNGDLSNIYSFHVQAPAPPIISSISPASLTARNVDQNITVNGTNFQQGLTVTVAFPNGSTGTLSGTQIQTVTATSFTMRITLGNAGSWNLKVNNPNGGQSNVLPFTVQSGVQSPSIFSINPVTPIARNTDQDVIVSGSNFQQNLVVDITFPAGGGTTLSGSQIQNLTSTSFIMRATLNAAGNWSIKVRNPDGGQSSVFGFSVTGGTNPVINNINSATPVASGADQNVIVNGSNFQNGLRVNVTFPNGGIATLQGTGQIQNVTANSFLMRITLNAAGSWSIRIVNPDNSQSAQFTFNAQASGLPPTGLPTSVLSPVIGSLRVTTTNQQINDGKWEFNQHKTGDHTPTGGISLSNNTFAWDVNLYTPTSGNADVGKAVFAVADGQVVSYVGTQPGSGPGAILIAHPNASNPVWFSGYLHMTNIRASLNEFVTPTAVIGEIGRTGTENDELHFVIYSGQNTRGNLQSFNAAITERSSSSTNTLIIDSVNPPSTTQSDNLQTIAINGSGFQPNSIIEVQTPSGQNFTITPETVSVVEAAKIQGITSSMITARIPFAFDGNYTLTIINRPGSSANLASENFVFPASSSSQYYVAPGLQKTPVVIIPGIMGSKIEERNGNGFNQLFPKFIESQQLKLKNHIGYGNPISERPIIATDILRTYANQDFYGTLISTLTGEYRGYKLYEVNNPNQRTSVGCDFSLRNDGANLYIFPYDWRSGNEQSAKDLRDYIICIGQRHGGINNPNFKVNIIAHSMGGLVARRYILEGLYRSSQNYDPKVGKMVTLGTPWLGAPEIILTMETGEKKGLNLMLSKPILKDVIRYMQGAHELIPSRAYVDGLADVNRGDFPFGEDGWDFDERNGIKQRYNFGELEFIMNKHQVLNTDPPHTTILPGTDTDLFHNKRYLNNKPLQDDWTGDQTGVTYYNFVGRCLNSQGAYNTVGSVIATKEWFQDWRGIWRTKNYLKPVMQRGDCTVPEISSMRQSGRGNYLGSAISRVFQNVEHSGLPNDSRVIQCIENVFAGLNPNSCSANLTGVYSPQNVNQIVEEPVYNLSVLGSRMVLISDSFGNTTNPLSTSIDEGVNTVSTTVTGEDFLNSIIPLDQNYKAILRTSESPLTITLTKKQGNTTITAIRYLDIAIPPNVFAQLEITPQGVSILKYDSDGNGTFDTSVNPTINVTGTQAQDTEPPAIVINETVQNGTSQIVLEATDAGTGIRRVMYSLNGTIFQPYSIPLTLTSAQTPTIYVFADDNVFNRSALITHNLTTSSVGFSLTAPSTSTPGSQIAVNWNAPSDRPADDWIGLFRIGALNSSYISKQYTGGQTSGNLSFGLPNQTGTYEFRYLINDEFASVAISNPIVVSNTRRSLFDFDGDGKSDISVFRSSNGAWYLLNSTQGFSGLQFGISTDKLVPGDYDGDGKTDVAVYRNGIWYLQRSSQGFTGVAFGGGNDIPVPADYNGDGRAELAVFRPSNGYWYILNLATNQFTAISFGQSGDKPVPADYDGDAKADIAVNRNGNWYIQRSQFGFTGIQFGDGNDKSVPADYDGDGKTDIAVFRPSNGAWYLLQSSNGFAGIAFGFGTDIPVPGDYDGDGKADLAVFRNGIWYLQRSTTGFTSVQFGVGTDVPIPNAYVP